MNNVQTGARRIVIAGGTGRLGGLLAKRFYDQGHSVSTIARFPKAQPWPAIHWDAESLGPWAEWLEGCDAVINLAGQATAGFLATGNQAEVFRSRLRTTELVAEAIASCKKPPTVWVNASSIAIYETSNTESLDETVATSNSYRQIENAALEFVFPATRVAVFRGAPVLHPAFGLFPHLLRLVRKGFGGAIGSGTQAVSWIHFADFVRAIEFLIDNQFVEGMFNLTAPDPLQNDEFMEILRAAWSPHHFGIGLPACLFGIEARIAGVDPAPFLESRRVTPRCLLAHGFWFDYPEWPEAAADLINRWRTLQTTASS